MLNGDGHIDTIHRLLVGAIEGGHHGYDASDATLVNAMWSLGLVSWSGGRAELWEPFLALMNRLSPQPPALLALNMDMWADPVRTGVAALPRLDAALRAVQREVDPHVIENLTASAIYADRLADFASPCGGWSSAGAQGGPARKQITALVNLCLDDFLRGDWGEAVELAAEGLRVSEERGGRFFGWYFRYLQALLAAVQGRFDTSRALASQVIGWAGPRGVRTAQVWTLHALVLADLGQGDFESAYQHATAMSPAGTLAPYVPHCLWVVMDLVEAAVRTHRQAEAEQHVHAMQEAGIAALSPRLAILAAGSAAIAADDERAPALFEETLRLPTVDQWPFDVARVRLAYGERLRRLRATAESRSHLEAALAAFQKLGAAPWASRAELELRATGRTRMPSRAPGVVALTPQELQIARLAASGMTNKQIAERLFLSPRTVGGHLYQIFPKLGITTRAALRDALDAADGSLGRRALRRYFRSATHLSSVACAAPGSVSLSAMAAAPLAAKPARTRDLPRSPETTHAWYALMSIPWPDHASRLLGTNSLTRAQRRRPSSSNSNSLSGSRYPRPPAGTRTFRMPEKSRSQRETVTSRENTTAEAARTTSSLHAQTSEHPGENPAGQRRTRPTSGRAGSSRPNGPVMHGVSSESRQFGSPAEHDGSVVFRLGRRRGSWCRAGGWRRRA